MKIPIKNDVTDFNYPNTDKYINMYSDQKPKLSITFDAIYIKLLAEQLIKFNGIKEFQPRMEFNFYDLENLEKAVEINLIKDKISKVNIVLMPLKLE